MRKPKVIDPSKPLKNPKYEIMARELAQGSNQVDAYKKAYPKASQTTANSQAHEVIARESINERAVKLLERAGLSEAKLAKSLNDCVDSADERVKLDSTKFGLNMIGYGKDQKLAESSYNPVQIIIEQFNVSSQVVTPKEDA